MHIPVEHGDLENLRMAILTDLEERWNWLCIPKSLMAASFLDPRFKSMNWINGGIIRDVLKFVQRAYDEEIQFEEVENVAKRAKMDQKPLKGLLKQLDEFIDSPSSGATIENNANSYAKEITCYKAITPVSMDTSPLNWWKEHEMEFPVLSRVARKYLAVQATSIPCERMFSTLRNTVTEKRNRLEDDIVEAMIMLHENIDLWDM